MSIEGDSFRITVKGSRESVVKMMNSALKSFNSDKVISESDDVETMNSKLELFIGKEGKDIGIPDLLGTGNNADVYRYLELVRIEDDAPGLIAKFSYYISENTLDVDDWIDYVANSGGWDTVALQYNCIVFLDDDWNSNGRFIRFGSATIYDASDGEIRRIHLESGSIYEAEEYPVFLRTLAHLYPDHYGVDWDNYHSKHPEVEISEEEYLAWFKEQKQPWQEQTEDFETEEVEPGSLSHLIDENGYAVIPDGTTEIAEMAFQDCANLVSVKIPDSVRVINYGAFYGCSGLTSVVIPEGVEEIQECVFKGCTALKDVTLPKSLKRISFDAFEDCPCEEAVMKVCEERSIIC